MTKAERSKLIEITNKILYAEPEYLPDTGFWRSQKGLKISTDDYEFIEPFVWNSRREVRYTVGAVQMKINSFRLLSGTFTTEDDTYLVVNDHGDKFKEEFREMMMFVVTSRTAFRHYREGGQHD